MLTKIRIKASARMREYRVGKGWLSPARFVILAFCVLLFVTFFALIYLQNVISKMIMMIRW